MKPCDVCRLIDSDTTPKDVAYCSLCDAWMCTRCRANWGRRLLAAALKQLPHGGTA